MGILSLFEGPVLSFLLGVALAYAALSMLSEYRKALIADPKAAMSFEVLALAVTSSGGPGYLAAFLLAGAALSFLAAAYSLLFSLFSYFGLSR